MGIWLLTDVMFVFLQKFSDSNAYVFGLFHMEMVMAIIANMPAVGDGCKSFNQHIFTQVLNGGG